LNWTVEYKKRALKQLRSLDAQVAIRVNDDMRHFAAQPNPRDFAAPLTGEWRGFWRFRMGDYRVICEIDDGKLVILVVKVGHRKDIYQ